MKPFRIAHLSDIHFGQENRDAVEAATVFLGRENLDLIIVSGDLTRYAEVPEFEAAATWLQQLTHPVLVTPGNHDAPYLDWAERVLTPFRRFERFIGPAMTQNWRGGGIAVRGINTARGAQMRLNWSKGRIEIRQAREAAAWFQSHDQFRIVVVHHPLIEMVGGPMSAKVRGGDMAAEVLAGAHVDLVLSGHIHAPFTWPYPGGDGRTYAVGAGTLSCRERGVPPGFNMVEIDAHEIKVTAHAWVRTHYEPFRTWSLDRRVADA